MAPLWLRCQYSVWGKEWAFRSWSRGRSSRPRLLVYFLFRTVALRLRTLAPPSPSAPRDGNPRDLNSRGSSSTTPFRKIVTPTPLVAQARALPLSGIEGSLLSGRDSTLTRKRREPGQRVLGRGYGGSRLQGKHCGGLLSRLLRERPLRWAASPSGRAALRSGSPAVPQQRHHSLIRRCRPPASALGKTLYLLALPLV